MHLLLKILKENHLELADYDVNGVIFFLQIVLYLTPDAFLSVVKIAEGIPEIFDMPTAHDLLEHRVVLGVLRQPSVVLEMRKISHPVQLHVGLGEFQLGGQLAGRVLADGLHAPKIIRVFLGLVIEVENCPSVLLGAEGLLGVKKKLEKLDSPERILSIL